jgi:protein-S-isoprenylcysteine O-methyltransferase Ste14
MDADWWLVAAGAGLILGVGGGANVRARRESALGAGLSRTTRAMMMVAFGGLGIAIVLAAVTRAVPMDLPLGVGLACGGVLVALGGATVAAVFTGARKRTWDVDTDRLVTTGVYGLTRNPRAVGWFTINVGLGLATRSWGVLALAGLFLLGYLPWILLEEVALERHFGATYRAYRSRTPRFVRLLPRGLLSRPSPDSAGEGGEGLVGGRGRERVLRSRVEATIDARSCTGVDHVLMGSGQVDQ